MMPIRIVHNSQKTKNYEPFIFISVKLSIDQSIIMHKTGLFASSRVSKFVKSNQLTDIRTTVRVYIHVRFDLAAHLT